MKLFRYVIGLLIVPMLIIHEADGAFRARRAIITQRKSGSKQTGGLLASRSTPSSSGVKRKEIDDSDRDLGKRYKQNTVASPEPVSGATTASSDDEKSDDSSDKDEKEVKELLPIPGLFNLGVTCYMNASLQCLFQLPVFNHALTASTCARNAALTEYIALRDSAEHPGDPLGTKKFFQTMFKKYFLPTRLRPRPNPSEQQDAQEFLVGFVDDASQYSDAFNFKQPSVLTCNTCHGKSYNSGSRTDRETKREMFSTNLSLAIPAGEEKSFTLKNLLDHHFNPEVLEGPNAVFCTSRTCAGAKRASTKKLNLETLPKILMIQLNRFDNDGSKRMNRVAFPLEGLSLDAYLTESKEASPTNPYDLVGIIYHGGRSAQSGHYISMVKNHQNNLWYCCDDDAVQAIDQKQVDRLCSGIILETEPKTYSFTPYVLIYIQKGATPEATIPEVSASETARAAARAFAQSKARTKAKKDDTDEAGAREKEEKKTPAKKDLEDPEQTSGDTVPEGDDGDDKESKDADQTPTAAKNEKIYEALRKGKKNMRNKKLQGADFSGFILDGVDFSGANLTNAKFCGARLSNIIFDGATIDETDFSGAFLTDITFKDKNKKQRMKWEDVKLVRVSLAAVNFNGIQMGRSDFSGAIMNQVEYNNVKNFVIKKAGGKQNRMFFRCNFSGARITRLTLQSCQFIGLNFERATLHESAIRDSKIENITIKNSPDITGLTFLRCTARNMDMQGVIANNLYFTASYLNKLNLSKSIINNLFINFAEYKLPEKVRSEAPADAAKKLNFAGSTITRGYLIGRMASYGCLKEGFIKVASPFLRLGTSAVKAIEGESIDITKLGEISINEMNFHSTKLTGFNVNAICFRELNGFEEMDSAQGCMFSNCWFEGNETAVAMILWQLKLKGAMVNGEVDPVWKDCWTVPQGQSFLSGLTHIAASAAVSTAVSTAMGAPVPVPA